MASYATGKAAAHDTINRSLSVSSFAENLSRYPAEQGLPYLANVPRGTHLVLFWENADAARMVEYWYLLHGLVRGEHCIYTTHGSADDIRSSMASKGLDVNYYEKDRKLLHIVEIEDPTFDSDGLTSGVVKQVKKMFANAQPPYRVISRLMRDIYSKERRMASIEVEATCHRGYLGSLPPDNPYSFFDHFPGSLMCHYPVDRYSAKTHADWLKNHLSSHHVAVFVPDLSHFRVFKL